MNTFWRVTAVEAGGHTHIWIRAGRQEHGRALCGKLVMENEEWPLLRAALGQLAGLELVERSDGDLREEVPPSTDLVTKSGREITEDDLGAWVNEAERGYDPDRGEPHGVGPRTAGVARRLGVMPPERHESPQDAPSRACPACGSLWGAHSPEEVARCMLGSIAASLDVPAGQCSLWALPRNYRHVEDVDGPTRRAVLG